MTSDRIAEIFAVIGKLLYIDEQGDVYASGCKAAVVALEGQNAAASGSADPYAELQQFVVPVLNSFKPVTQALDRLSLIARSGVDNYLRTIAGELGQQATTAPATILNALKVAMVATGDDVQPSGSVYGYFVSNYGLGLPMANPPSIPDSIITVAII